MAKNLSASGARRPLTPGILLLLISVRGYVDFGSILWLEELGQLEIPVESLGIEPVTFPSETYCLN